MSSSTGYAYASPDAQSTGGGTSGSGGFYVSSFEELLSQMLSAYDPALVQYSPLDEQQALLQIAAWLRPAFDAAIAARGKQTAFAAAELDTDAYARGMGSSSYVSDVKARNLMDEADDVREMDGDYASKLAQYLYQAVEADRTRALEVAKFNAEQTNQARAHAASAAQSAYAAQTTARSGGSGTKSAATASSAAGNSLLSTLGAGSSNAKAGEDALAFYRSLSASQKQLFFNTGSLTYAKQRNALLQAYGAQKYNALRSSFLKGAVTTTKKQNGGTQSMAY